MSSEPDSSVSLQMPAADDVAAALAVAVPTQAAEPVCEDVEAGASSRPASPLNIHSLLNRPFGDVSREIISSFQLRSTAQVAADQLRYLVFHRDHDREVLANPGLMAHLLQQVHESPGLAAAGSCMFVLAHLARTPAGRAQLRTEGVIPPVLRFLSMPDVQAKANAEPAMLLLQNISSDRQSRVTLLMGGAVELLLRLLSASPVALKQQAPRVAAAITGTLLNLVAGAQDERDSSATKHLFAKAGGLQAGCKVLAAWGRYDHSAAALRLRLLLADIGKLQQYTLTLHQTALDACTSARTAATQVPAGSARGTSGPGAGQLVVPDVSAEVIAGAGKGIPLGVPRMPASERLTDAVLQHGRDLGDKGPEQDEEAAGAAS